MRTVSVIVPCYNMSATVIDTLRSVCASTYKDIEVVVADDGSTDNSAELVLQAASVDPRIHLVHSNAGNVAKARNYAIRHSSGFYILPVDADDRISPTFIQHAVEAIEKDENIKAVGARAEFFGDKTGEWITPDFSLPLLARKNMIPISALYRRLDYDKTDGYNEHLPIREDWDFWLSIFANGGEFVKLPEVGLYYRIHQQSKRVTDRDRKRELISELNRRHAPFFRKYLGGPLHYHRSWSRLLNLFRRETTVGTFDHWDEGDIIFERRNTLRRYKGLVIKQFATPSFFRSFIYGFFRSSKAKRSYEHAFLLGQMTPKPIAYKEVRVLGLLRESYYVSEESATTHTFNDLIDNHSFPNRSLILQHIGRFTALMHQKGLYHQDYSGGNILFACTPPLVHIEVVDLNRMLTAQHINMQQGCRQFERLPVEPEALDIMARAYAETMAFDPDQCCTLVRQMRWWKHKRKKQ